MKLNHKLDYNPLSLMRVFPFDRKDSIAKRHMIMVLTRNCIIRIKKQPQLGNVCQRQLLIFFDEEINF